MVTVDGNVEELALAIVGEARAEADELRAGAQTKADAIRKRATAEAERERQAILLKANEEAERTRAQGLATAHLRARSLELEHRERLLNRVFAAASERLSSVQQRKDYEAIARRLAGEALSQLHSPKAQIVADEATRHVLTRHVLDEIAKDLQMDVSVGDVLPRGLGVVAQTVDEHLQFDNTLETRLARMQTTLRAAVYGILIGEAK
jgi:vacuolar-type H+-ATPase subunit E/Vma4